MTTTPKPKQETRGRKRKNRDYISFKSFEKKFDCTPYTRKKIAKEQGFTEVPLLDSSNAKHYPLHEVEKYEKSRLKLTGE